MPEPDVHPVSPKLRQLERFGTLSAAARESVSSALLMHPAPAGDVESQQADLNRAYVRMACEIGPHALHEQRDVAGFIDAWRAYLAAVNRPDWLRFSHTVIPTVDNAIEFLDLLRSLPGPLIVKWSVLTDAQKDGFTALWSAARVSVDVDPENEIYTIQLRDVRTGEIYCASPRGGVPSRS